jgi:long-chain acyl-CoA synthetase
MTQKMDHDRDHLLELATGEKAAFALTEVTLGGITLPVFRHGPRHLRELYASSLLFEDRVFLVYEGERYTFRECWQQAAALAERLLRRGIGKGDRVAIAMRNYPEFVLSYMAVTSIGAVAVALNGWWTGSELHYGLSDSGARLAIVDGERLERILPLPAALSAVELWCCRPSRALPPGVEAFSRRPGDASAAQMPEVDIAPDDDANILYTSGSTGQPGGRPRTAPSSPPS